MWFYMPTANRFLLKIYDLPLLLNGPSVFKWMAELGPNEATVVTSLKDESRLQRLRSGKLLYSLRKLKFDNIHDLNFYTCGI